MIKKTVRLNESDLRNIINECVNKVLKEGVDFESSPLIKKIQQLINDANNAYNNAKETCGDDRCLMGRNEDSFYGLRSDIYLDGKGYINIPFNEYEGTVRIKVIRKLNGKIVINKGDYYTEGWDDAKKMLKKIIRDAEIGIKHFQGYDPNWEYSDSPEELKANRNALKQFNKSIGRKANLGIEYLN